MKRIMRNEGMKEVRNNNRSQKEINNSYPQSKKLRRIGIAEGKLPDLDLEIFNSVNVEELFYGKNS